MNKPTAPFNGGTRDPQNPKHTFNVIFSQICNGLIGGLGRQAIEEIEKGNQMTALRFQTRRKGTADISSLPLRNNTGNLYSAFGMMIRPIKLSVIEKGAVIQKL